MNNEDNLWHPNKKMPETKRKKINQEIRRLAAKAEREEREKAFIKYQAIKAAREVGSLQDCIG